MDNKATEQAKANILVVDDTPANLRLLSSILIEQGYKVRSVIDGMKTKADFEAGLHLYQDKKFAEASVKFNHVLEQDPQDKAARLYLQRAAHFMVHGVPPDWAGVETLTEK